MMQILDVLTFLWPHSIYGGVVDTFRPIPKATQALKIVNDHYNLQLLYLFFMRCTQKNVNE